MGVVITYNCWDSTCKNFNIFRNLLCEKVGYDMHDFEGFGGTKSFEEFNHDVKPLIDHEDNEGTLSVSEQEQILRGLNSIESVLNLDNSKDKFLKKHIDRFIEGITEAIDNNDILEFR